MKRKKKRRRKKKRKKKNGVGRTRILSLVQVPFDYMCMAVARGLPGIVGTREAV